MPAYNYESECLFQTNETAKTEFNQATEAYQA